MTKFFPSLQRVCGCMLFLPSRCYFPLTHVTLPEGGAGEVRHRQPDGDQPAGADITHVGGLLSGGLEAIDGLTDCRPPLSRLSPLSGAAPGSFRQGMTLAHLTWL